MLENIVLVVAQVVAVILLLCIVFGALGYAKGLCEVNDAEEQERESRVVMQPDSRVTLPRRTVSVIRPLMRVKVKVIRVNDSDFGGQRGA